MYHNYDKLHHTPQVWRVLCVWGMEVAGGGVDSRTTTSKLPLHTTSFACALQFDAAGVDSHTSHQKAPAQLWGLCALAAPLPAKSLSRLSWSDLLRISIQIFVQVQVV